jgi:hypothetical protein
MVKSWHSKNERVLLPAICTRISFFIFPTFIILLSNQILQSLYKGFKLRLSKRSEMILFGSLLKEIALLWGSRDSSENSLESNIKTSKQVKLVQTIIDSVLYRLWLWFGDKFSLIMLVRFKACDNSYPRFTKMTHASKVVKSDSK